MDPTTNRCLRVDSASTDWIHGGAIKFVTSILASGFNLKGVRLKKHALRSAVGLLWEEPRDFSWERHLVKKKIIQRHCGTPHLFIHARWQSQQWSVAQIPPAVKPSSLLLHTLSDANLSLCFCSCALSCTSAALTLQATLDPMFTPPSLSHLLHAYNRIQPG